MSTTTEITVWCDEPECSEWSFGSGNNHTVEQARRGVREQGWTRGPGTPKYNRTGRLTLCDYCPEHSARREPGP